VLDPKTTLPSDPATIRRDLEYMTRHWHQLSERPMLEIRALGEGMQTQSGKFALDWMDDAVEFAVGMNRLGRNVYAVRNPIRERSSGSASDTDIIAARYLWADCDDPIAAGNVLRFDGPKWTAAVTTGKIPNTRAHVYWELSEWCYDLDQWRAMQTTIAAHFASDPAVINPSRIMRLAGTITYPAAKKRERGYVSELVTLNTDYNEPRLPVTLDQMARVFGSRQPARQTLSQQAVARVAAPPGAFQIDTGNAGPSLDRERVTIQALSGQDWHNAVIRLVASYVAKGLSDTEIHALTQPLTLAGYTGDQTAQEVRTAIDGARRKGFTPEPKPTYAPNFDHAPAPTQSDPEPSAGGWTMQSAAAFTADFVAPEYIVDGVVRRGMLYTLTAPTGSGKTAVMLYAATAIAMGEMFGDRECEQGDVIFMAGENPDDVRARMIATMEYSGIDPARCRVHFIAGTFSIKNDLARIADEAAKLPNLVLIVVDTFAAYFPGDDENNNAQALDFARVVRKMTVLPSKPAVVMPAHPVKNASRSNLSPKGGSSLVNEVDGNLTLWNDGGVVTLHWQVKFRGAEFEPLNFELKRRESEKLRDAKGRLMPTILAIPMLTIRKMELAKENLTKEEQMLFSLSDNPEFSLMQHGIPLGFNHPQKVTRILVKLEKQKLVKKLWTGWELTSDGKRVVEKITNGGKFDPEI
jgi:hypothetical protein